MTDASPHQPLLDRFVDHLEVVRNLAPSTVRHHRQHVAGFLDRWARTDGAGLEAVRFRRHAARIEVYSPTEAAAVLAHTAALTDRRGRQRHAIVATFRYTGARVGEVSNLRRDRIDLAARRLEVLGKGSRHRTLAIPAPLAAVLGEFLAEVRPHLPDTPYLFVNDHPLVPDPDRRCSIWSLQRETRLAAEGAGLPGRHHPHRWRHSFATELIRAGVSVAHVQRQLGHASIVSTMIYTHLDVDDVRRSLDEVFDPP